MAFPLHCVLLVLAGVIFLPQAEGQCNFGWGLYRDASICYFFSDTYVTWNQAARQCRIAGGYLTDIINIFEKEFLRKEMSKKDADSVWIGGHKRRPNTPWLWTNDYPIDSGAYLNWEKHHPRNISSTHMCMKMERKDGQWIDEKCSEKKRYVCKNDAIPRT